MSDGQVNLLMAGLMSIATLLSKVGQPLLSYGAALEPSGVSVSMTTVVAVCAYHTSMLSRAALKGRPSALLRLLS